MRRLRFAVGLVLVAGAAGCYSHEPILKLNRSNREYLERLEIRLSLSSEQAAEYAMLAEADKPAFLQAKRRANLEELRELFADTSAVKARLMLDLSAVYARHGVAEGTVAAERPASLNFELAQLQERYYRELDDQKRRAVIADALEDLITALQALRQSGERIDEYLDMGFFARTFTEARALDREKLEEIADDLKAVGERLKPLLLPE